MLILRETHFCSKIPTTKILARLMLRLEIVRDHTGNHSERPYEGDHAMRDQYILAGILAGYTGGVTERPRIVSGLVDAAPAVAADSASICWQRFSRGVSIEGNCTSLGVIARVDTVHDTVRVATFVSEPYVCAALMWHYDPAMWARAEYQAQFQDASSVARQRVAKSCRRPS